jgi:hypothetical protein
VILVAENTDFSSFLKAVAESGDEDKRVRDTRHTSSVSSADWKRVEAARKDR